MNKHEKQIKLSENLQRERKTVEIVKKKSVEKKQHFEQSTKTFFKDHIIHFYIEKKFM